MLSQRTKDELRAEAARLRARAAQLDEIAADGDATQQSLRAAKSAKAAGQTTLLIDAPPGWPPVEGGPVESTKDLKTSTFADDVRRALRGLGRIAKSKEVAAWLEKHGGSEHTTRELRGACAVELFRMSAKGLGVKKVSRGRYRIDDAA